MRCRFHQLELSSIFNSQAATFDSERHLGMLNAWGNSLPAEELFDPYLTSDLTFPLAIRRNGDCGAYDNLEPFGHVVRLPDRFTIRVMHVLSCAEMGERELTVWFRCGGNINGSFSVRCRAWMCAEDLEQRASVIQLSHAHFPGGYELNTLKPTLSLTSQYYSDPVVADELEFGWHPLVHIFAVTLELASYYEGDCQ